MFLTQDAQITSANKSISQLQNLRQPGAVFINAIENSSLVLTCELKSNPQIEQVVWYYYQLNKQNQMVNKVSLSNSIQKRTIINDVSYSQLSLNEVAFNNTGYYSCAINNVLLNDSLGQRYLVNKNASFFLQVQCELLIRPILNKFKDIFNLIF